MSIYAAEWQGVVGPKKRGPKKKGEAISGNGAGNTSGDKRDEVAKKYGIGGRTVSKAANVLEKGCKQLQHAGDKQLEIDAAEVRLRSERRLGELMKGMPKAKPPGENQHTELRVNRKPEAQPTLDSLGIDKNLSPFRPCGEIAKTEATRRPVTSANDLTRLVRPPENETMLEEIKVYVVKYKDRDNFAMKYTDPMTGKNVRRSTGTHKRREAEKIAAKWEAELQEGRYQKRNRMSWDEFCERFDLDGTGGLKSRTVSGYMESLAAFQRLCRPRGVFDLTTAKMTAFTRELRKPRIVTIGKGKKQRKETVKLSEASVARHLRHLKKVSRWAQRQGYLASAPCFEMPSKASGARRMKGRPITTEEFERMLAAVPQVVGVKAAESWKQMLRVLWASGLRLSEALLLRWDPQPDGVRVMLNGKKSVLAFDADSQKSGKVQLVPLAPEAVELLEPLQAKQGYVIEIRRQDGLPMARDVLKASKIISKFGKKANVVVDAAKGKCASAHDLRRAFAFRWSRLVRTPELKELMRHASIETTLTYYVGQNAEATSEGLWDALGHKLGHMTDATESKPKKTPAK